jgi:RNA polymerase sigma factor for flagellar operon FliA
MLDYLRKEDWMPRNLRQQAKIIQAVVHELKSAGSDVTDEEIATRLNMSIEEVRQIRGQTQKRVRVSNQGSEDFDGDYLETCVADTETSVVDDVIEQENEARLQEAMHRLPEKEQMVLQLYFIEGQNLREIGEEMGVTESRACQLRKSGVSRLQKMVQQ